MNVANALIKNGFPSLILFRKKSNFIERKRMFEIILQPFGAYFL